MDELPYALSEEDFVRMSNAVRRVEGLPPRRDSQAFNRAAPENAPHNWIKVTSTTLTTINLTGGGTVQGYPAVWSFFDSRGSGWTDTTNVTWFLGANGETPVLNQRYHCRCLGVDSSGVPIWATDIPGQSTTYVKILSPATVFTITLSGGTIQGYKANLVTQAPSTGAWTVGASVWFFPINGQVPLANNIFQVQQLGADTMGVAVWEASIFQEPADITASLSGDVTGPTASGANTTILTITPPAFGTWLIYGQMSAQVVGSSGNVLIATLVPGSGGPTVLPKAPAIVASPQGTGVTTQGTATCMGVVVGNGNPVNLAAAVSPNPGGVLTSSTILSFGSSTNLDVSTMVAAVRVA